MTIHNFVGKVRLKMITRVLHMTLLLLLLLLMLLLMMMLLFLKQIF